jgi:chromosome segregation ATPase
MSKRDEYAARMKQQIDETNQAIDELERKAAKAADAAEKKYDEQIAKLRQQSNQAMAKLEALKSGAEEGWEKLVGEIENIGKALKQSFNYFKSQL